MYVYLEFFIYVVMSPANEVLFLPFSSVLFISFSCLVALARTSAQCWIDVARVYIFVLLLILGRKLLVFHHEYDVNCEFFLGALYQAEEILLFFLCFVFSMKGCSILSNAFFLCVCLLILSSVFPLYFINMVYYTDLFSYVEPTLYFWDKTYVVMLFNFLNIFWDSIC